MPRRLCGSIVLGAIVLCGLLAATPGAFAFDAGYANVIFLHHSTGANLIAQGNVRPLLTGLGYDFWDHGYNVDGLTMPDGTVAPYIYNIPDNTNPDGLAAIFAQEYRPDPATGTPFNAFSGLLRHDVVIFKSCFPASAISDDDMLNQYKAWYVGIRDRAELFPDHLFIAFSTPPLTPLATNRAEAKRARAFANWLKSQAFLAGHPNFFVFDFFGLLAEPEGSRGDRNMLRDRYRPADPPDDSHPNLQANRRIGPVFAHFIDNAVNVYAGGCLAAPGMPDRISPADGAGFAPGKVLLRWSSEDCTAYYQVEVRRDGAGGPKVVAEIAAQGRLRTPPLAAGLYFWRVAACSNLGCSTWTPFGSFTVNP